MSGEDGSPEASAPRRPEAASGAAATQQQSLSLTQDAWRRFRRRRSSVIAMSTLAAVVVLSVLTPLLPLQPPDRDQTKQKFAPPTASPLWLETFELDLEQIDKLAAQLPEKREAQRAAAAALAQTRREKTAVLESDAADKAAKDAAEEAINDAFRASSQARAAVSNLVQSAYADAGFPKLGPVARWMVRTRYAVFGGYELNSLCGRDKLGRDILSRIFWGSRISLIVGVVATLVSLVIGVTYGAVSGYAGGWIDNLMMRIVDVLYSIPFIFVVIFLISVLTEDEVREVLEQYGVDRITVFYLVVGAIYWLTMARVVRGQVLSLKNELFVEAALSMGVSQRGIIFRHIVPNLFSIVIVYLTLTIPRVILFEAFLSFLGLGVEAPDVSWGLLADQGIKVITPVKIYWWLILFPSVAIGVTLFALNFLGDGLRDAFDPKLKNQ
ncbi:MAG: ABC transporter permease [Planctomycetota bacterium]